ncbi:MAG: YraN family protein [Solirubrobacterales bacterium]|jgi:putative endonuclease|nr:YraN family protein [Solirubrobacterales bacterium]
MSASDHRGALGRRGEDLAVAHLERLGYAVIARNHRTRYGEIDVIASDGRTLVFAEVKTRRGASRSPLESVREGKQGQVRRMASAWLAEDHDRPRTRELRFDAIGVALDTRGRLVALEHVEGAF